MTGSNGDRTRTSERVTGSGVNGTEASSREDRDNPPDGSPAAGRGEVEPPEYGETWTYESIVGALPGIGLSGWQAVAIQFGLFETGVLLLAVVYGVQDAAVAGTAAVAVASTGSVAMLRFSRTVRSVDLPASYRRLLFGSNVEVVLAVLAFIALVLHLFVVDPARSQAPLLRSLFGADPPVVVLYLALLVLWDLCYRIGAAWWAAVVSLWRSIRFEFDAAAAKRLRQADGINVAFAATQLVLLPFLRDRPVLLTVVGGHVVAVAAVSMAAVLLLRVRNDGPEPDG